MTDSREWEGEGLPAESVRVYSEIPELKSSDTWRIVDKSEKMT